MVPFSQPFSLGLAVQHHCTIGTARSGPGMIGVATREDCSQADDFKRLCHEKIEHRFLNPVIGDGFSNDPSGLG
jgi:hypothetical protein